MFVRRIFSTRLYAVLVFVIVAAATMAPITTTAYACRISDYLVTVQEVQRYGSSKCEPGSWWKPTLDWLLALDLETETAEALANGDTQPLRNCWLSGLWGGCQRREALTGDICTTGKTPIAAAEYRMLVDTTIVLKKSGATEDDLYSAVPTRNRHSALLAELFDYRSWCQWATIVYADHIVTEYNRRLQHLSR